jgi:osmoprotectant transport system permease protein
VADALQRSWRIAVLAAVFALGVQMQKHGVLASIAKYWGDIVYLSKQHMEMVAVSGALAILVGVMRAPSSRW